MWVKVHGHGLELSESLKLHVERRLDFAIARRSDRGDRVDVLIARDGPDFSCRVLADVKGGAEIVVQAVASDAYSSVDLASGRLVAALGSHLERARARRERRAAGGTRTP
jgi:ribosome-associated translation inhibitor RaiA